MDRMARHRKANGEFGMHRRRIDPQTMDGWDLLARIGFHRYILLAMPVTMTPLLERIRASIRQKAENRKQGLTPFDQGRAPW